MSTKGGPNTIAGKQKVSENALKHGATSARFINDDERIRAAALLEQLQQHYITDNPLIDMQLERIVRIKIQLERIQNTIDAEFELARSQLDPFETMVNATDLSEDIKKVITGIHILPEKMQATDKLIYAKTSILSLIMDEIGTHPKNAEEFLACCPLLCRYLYNLSLSKSISLRQVIQTELKTMEKNSVDMHPWLQAMNDMLNDINSSDVEDADSQNADIRHQQYSLLKKAILSIDFEELIRLSLKYSSEIANNVSAWEKAIRLNSLIPAAMAAATPDLEKLDKLMRYQTTLQRQLSTCIGELLALTKKSGKSVSIDSLDVP